VDVILEVDELLGAEVERGLRGSAAHPVPTT